MPDMQRKHVYILVSILTIILVSANHFIEQDYQNDKDGNLDVEQITETYKGAEISSPLVIKNIQNDESDNLYIYSLKIESAVGAYRYEYNEKESYLVFSATGETQISLKNNESITIYDLPKNKNYTIEQITDVSQKYSTKVNKEETKIASGQLSLENNIEFYNETIIAEEKEENKKNPVTSDNYTLGIICFIIALFIFIALKKIKIERFEI